MPVLYESTDSLVKLRPHTIKRLSASPESFWWGLGAGLVLGFFIFTSLGRELVKTAAGITEEEIRRRIEERKRR
jgi:hypothetical protein